MFEIWILIFYGSDNHNPKFEHVVWSDLIGQQLGRLTDIQGTMDSSWDTLGTVATFLSPLQDFVIIILAA